MTYTFNRARETKGGYLRYEHQGLGSIYLSKTILLAEPPAVVTITADGLAEPRVAPEQDPATLQAAATKAAERAQRAAERAQRLAEQVARLQPPPTAEQPAAKRQRKAKAAA